MFKRFLEKFQADKKGTLIDCFTKAAIAGNAVAAGYAANGKIGGIVSGVTFFAGFLAANTINRDDEYEQAALDFIDPKTKIGAKIQALKENAGIQDPMTILLMPPSHSPYPGVAPRRDTDNGFYLILPSKFLENSSEKDVLALIGHELAHVKHEDFKTAIRYETGGHFSTKLNTYTGVLHSVVSLSPIPVLISACGRISHKALAQKMIQNHEYMADYFASTIKGGISAKQFFRAYKRVCANMSSVTDKALRKQAEHLKKLPEWARKKFQGIKVPEFLIRARIGFDRIFRDDHPASYKRLQKISGIVREEDPDFEYPAPEDLEEQSLTLCESCLELNSENKRANIKPYLVEAFHTRYGHRNLKIDFDDCGGIPPGFMIPGGVITFGSPSPFDGQEP